MISNFFLSKPMYILENKLIDMVEMGIHISSFDWRELHIKVREKVVTVSGYSTCVRQNTESSTKCEKFLSLSLFLFLSINIDSMLRQYSKVWHNKWRKSISSIDIEPTSLYAFSHCGYENFMTENYANHDSGKTKW